MKVSRTPFFLLAMFFLLLPAGLCNAQDNPFKTKKEDSNSGRLFSRTSPQNDKIIAAEPTLTESILKMQKSFHEGLSDTLRKAKSNLWSWELFLLLSFSFLYGVFHTVLPGHQKSVIGAYFLSENARYGQGFLAGGLFALFHAVTAITVLIVLRMILQMTAGKSLDQATAWTQILSAYGVMIVGLVLFIMKLRDLKEMKRKSDLDRIRRVMGFDLHERIENTFEPIPWRKFLPFIFFAAVLPCPGTLLVLLFALSLGAIGLGLASVLMISFGMAITLTALALFVIWMKKRGKGLTYKTPGRWGVFSIEVAGLVMLVVLALLMLPAGSVS